MLFVGVLIAAAVIPQFVGPFALSILVLVVIFAVLAMSLDLLMGYTGMESLGQAAFFGMAGYTLAILATRYEVGWQLAIPIALFASVATAAIGGVLAVRLTGVFFLVMTLVFSQVLWGLAEHWGQVTGGHLGLHGITRPFDALASDLTFYYVALAVCLLSGLLMYRLVRSPFGLTLRGIKDSDLRMKTSGYNVWLHRFIVFVIAGLFAGIAGVLYTYSTEFISPTILGVDTSFEAMLMVIVGGGDADRSYHRSGGCDRTPELPERLYRELDHRSRVGLHLDRLLRAKRGLGVTPPEVARSVPAVGQEPAVADTRVEIEPRRPPPDLATNGQGGAETLRLEGVGKSFGRVRAVHEVSLTTFTGTRRAILGPNGAGKTTLFNLISGVYKPSHGNIRLFGDNVTSVAPHMRTRMGLSRTYQITNLFPSLTVMNNVRLGVLGVKPNDTSCMCRQRVSTVSTSNVGACSTWRISGTNATPWSGTFHTAINGSLS